MTTQPERIRWAIALSCRSGDARARRLRRRRRAVGRRRRSDRRRHLAAAHRGLLRARQGRPARLRGLGEDRQRQGWPARPPGRAEDPRRPVQRRPGRRRLRAADRQGQVDLVVGPFSTRLVVPAARVAEEYGMLFVEPAGAAQGGLRAGLQEPVLRRPGGRRRPLQPPGRVPAGDAGGPAAEDRGVRGDGRPVRAGHRVRAEGQAGGRRRQDRRRRGLPAEHHRLRQHRGEDRGVQGGHGGRRLAVPGRRQPDRRPAAARLPAQARRVLDRADQPRVRQGDRQQDRGHPVADRLHARRRRTRATRSSSRSTPRSSARRRRRTRRTRTRPARSSAAAVTAVGLRRAGRLPEEAGRLAARQRGGDRGRPADLGRAPAGRRART